MLGILDYKVFSFRLANLHVRRLTAHLFVILSYAGLNSSLCCKPSGSKTVPVAVPGLYEFSPCLFFNIYESIRLSGCRRAQKRPNIVLAFIPILYNAFQFASD